MIRHLITVCSAALFAIALTAEAEEAKKDEPAAQGPIKLTLSCDKKEYMHGEPGVMYFVAPTGQLKAKLSWKNASNKPVTVEFRSGQKCDFVIRDAKGNVVKKSSEDMGFMQMIMEIHYAPGDEETCTQEISLGEVAKPLPLGDYFLEGIVTSTPPHTAKIPFKIIATPDKKQ